MTSYKYEVVGMHCASCASTITRKISKLSNVENVQTSYANKTLEFNSINPIPTETLNSAIKHLGYEVVDRTVKNNESLHDHAQMELSILKTNVIISLPLVLISIGMMIWENFLPYPAIAKTFFHHLLPVMATYMLFVVGLPYLQAVIRFIKYRAANMDTLVGIGTSVAYLYSFILSAFENVLMPYVNTEHIYYDVTIVVIGFITLGKYLEARSKQKTGQAIEKLLGLQAKTAIVLRGGKEVEIPIENVVVGDIMVVKPGGKIPLDGEIIKGETSVDESMLTGESLPVDKFKGSKVIGGTLNKQGSIQIRSTVVGEGTVLSRIVKMVQEAQSSHAPVERLTDQISAVFVPVVLILSVLTFIIWTVLGSPLMGLLGFIGILVIACPCALGLATPTAIIVGVGRAASLGILIKNAESLEKLRNTSYVVFDKTGTVTKGELSLTQSRVIDFDESRAFSILATLEKESEHPIARAIMEYVKSKNIHLQNITKFRALAGLGVQGNVAGKNYYAGNVRMIENLGLKVDQSIIQDLANTGATPIILASSKEIILYAGVSDTLKSDAPAVVKSLHKLGIKVALLTGDHQLTAAYIGKKLGIDHIFADVMPEDKATHIKNLQAEGYSVTMVGDGVNDAPALSTADVGVAMGTGTDIAIESAGLTLLGGNLERLIQSLKLAKATFSVVKQNLFWAFIYNIIGIPIAAGALYALYGIMLNPAIAGAAMAFSSVSVVSNSLRLKTIKL